MGRIIGIDYGARRVGIAVTDPMQLIASPLTTLPTQEVLTFLKRYTTTEPVEAIIVGIPIQLNGRLGKAMYPVQKFIRTVVRHFPSINVWGYDERFTSSIAYKSIMIAGYKKKKREQKGALDRISATLILRSYLESPDTAITIPKPMVIKAKNNEK
ncbi:MAG: Holliday junction resolvase RuvX [Bacteroidota bacterium]